MYLDAASPFILVLFPLVGIVTFLLVILIEAGVFTALKLEKFRGNFINFTFANVGSALAGFVLLYLTRWSVRQVELWVVAYFITVLVEFAILRYFYKDTPAVKLMGFISLANLITYIFLFLTVESL